MWVPPELLEERHRFTPYVSHLCSRLNVGFCLSSYYGNPFKGRLFLPFIIYPPTTSQFVLSDVDQRFEETFVCFLRQSCGEKRRTPLTGESERVLPQSGHSTNVTPLSVNRLRSMGTTILENVHLGDVLVCTCSFAVSTVFVVFCCSFP